MILTKEIELARRAANVLHKGQFRSDKKTPKMDHVQGVVDRVEDRLKPVAYLHDVLEKTPVTINDLRNVGFSQYVLNIVDLLTRKKEDSREEYWGKVATNKDAVTVKFADIADHFSHVLSRHRQEKYVAALKFFANRGYKYPY
jgi:(p)ppGpp synthase/HD superfamily hydrolase